MIPFLAFVATFGEAILTLLFIRWIYRQARRLGRGRDDGHTGGKLGLEWAD